MAARHVAFLFEATCIEGDVRAVRDGPLRTISSAESAVAVVHDEFLQKLRCCLPDPPARGLDHWVVVEPIYEVVDLATLLMQE